MISLSAIQQAAHLLEAGKLVAFPTETVYGLGADAENTEAVAQIYAVKQRPVFHPLIVHIAASADAGYWIETMPIFAKKLIDTFWPGPLTLIFKRAPSVCAAASGGQDSIGLRCPAHPIAQGLLTAFKQGKGGIAAPSANHFGHISPTTAQHVRDEFGEPPDSAIAAILDGGSSEIGIESTIIDVSRGKLVLLRPGKVTAEAVANVTGHWPDAPDHAAPRASGTLAAHYAPRTAVALVDSTYLISALQKLAAANHSVALLHYSVLPLSQLSLHAHQPLGNIAEHYAAGLYAALRTLDKSQAQLILIEIPPVMSGWEAVHDRLQRAAQGSHFDLTFTAC